MNRDYRQCSTCACRNICKQCHNADISKCENWIGEEELASVRAAEVRPAFTRLAMRRFKNHDSDGAEKIMNMGLQSTMEDFRRYLETHDPLDHPMVLSAMGIFARIQTEAMPAHFRELGQLFDSATQCVQIDTSALRRP